MNDRENLEKRFREYALSIVRLYCTFPKTTLAQVIGKQFLRSGTSPGAHYREGRRARSNAEFISKFEVGSQELDETLYWIELAVDSHIITDATALPIIKETNELISILTASIKTVKTRKYGS